jgi:hypothetical protein
MMPSLLLPLELQSVSEPQSQSTLLNLMMKTTLS